MVEWLAVAAANTLVFAPIAYIVGMRAAKKVNPRRKDNGASIKWCWYTSPLGATQGFMCPKCLAVGRNTKRPKLCTCLEFERDHFHFKCAGCEYTAIMRTADDP
jgi:hypothetical protein